MRLGLAYWLILMPVVVSPVNAILRIRLEDARALPATPPEPVTTFSTPAVSRSPMSSTSTMMEAGVTEAGFRTMQFPAARAGATFQTAIRLGKVHGRTQERRVVR